MQLNPGNGLGLVDEINDICHSDNNSYPLPSKIRRLNNALDRYVMLRLMNSRSFHFNDINYPTEFPIGYAELRSGEDNVPFPADVVSVKNLFVKDTESVYHEITEETTPLNTLLRPTNSSGVPSLFRIVGHSIVFDKTPNYTQTDGVMGYFVRAASKFLVTDTTKEPGIPVIFHTWLAQYASLPYLIEQQKANKNDIAIEIARGEEAIKFHASNFNATRKPRLGIRQENNR